MHAVLSEVEINTFREEIKAISRTLDNYEYFVSMVRQKILNKESHQVKHQVDKLTQVIVEKLGDHSTTPLDVKAYVRMRLEIIEDPEDFKLRDQLSRLLEKYGVSESVNNSHSIELPVLSPRVHGKNSPRKKESPRETESVRERSSSSPRELLQRISTKIDQLVGSPRRGSVAPVVDAKGENPTGLRKD